TGVLNGVSVELSGLDVDFVFASLDFAGFGTANFTPSTNASDAVTLLVAFDGSSTYTVTFGSAVKDPVIHIAGDGFGFFAGLDGTMSFSAPVSVVSGTGLSAAGMVLTGTGGGEGTVQLS